jgi:hypothetical protein
MVALALWNERRDRAAAPRPRLSWGRTSTGSSGTTTSSGSSSYVPVGIALLVRDRAACLRMLWVGGG